MTARTIGNIVELKGAGLHSGEVVHLCIKPARAGHGIRFVRVDLAGAPSLSSRDLDTEGAPFRTTLKKGLAEVHTVEHLLSALAGLGITDCEIEADGIEMPGLDGSALSYCEALLGAGVAALAGHTVKALVVNETLTIHDGAASIEARPCAEGFEVNYTLDYPGHPLAQGSYEFHWSEENYLREIAPARTFAIRPEAEKMIAAGLGKGANSLNTVVVDGAYALDTPLRFPDEPVRHKILDLIGDLYVIGRPLRAHIVARCSGHRTNRMLALALMQTEKNEG